MKRFLLFAMGAMMTMSSFAQEDVTSYIQNAGFDEDLTFQADGAMKEIVSTETSLSERSWAYVATDNSVYAKPKSTSSQQRKDGVDKLTAVNGFIGQVNGWTIETNQEFPKCEWVYFGTIPYTLGDRAIPIADDGDTYLGVPTKPTADSGDDNVGFAYLRAGWGGRAVYKQVVKLPCAKYRLEYWAININPNGTNGKNLSKVTCRKDKWEDETGFTDQEWTLHSIEFTPTSEFTMEFGFESSGGSGSNPFLCIDAIKLYKIDEADPAELLTSLAYDCQDLNAQAAGVGYTSLADYINDYAMKLEDLTTASTEEIVAAIEQADKDMDVFRAAIDEIANVNAILTKMDKILQTTDYAGKADLEAAYQRIQGYKDNYTEGTDVPALIMGAVDEANNAIKAYYMTQTGSEENPADFTLFIQNPWFINTAAEPVLEDGVWVFPNELNEETGESNYVDGSASSPDLNSTGWYVAGGTGGDQRLNWKCGRSCWNAWNSNFSNTIAVAQDIEGLPNGYYTVSADLITQSGCLTDQHVYAQSVAEKKISSNGLTTEGWDYNEWETVAMTATDKVLVVDGKLTIGAEGTGTGSGAAGWFMATNFHLYYLGEAGADALKTAFDAKVASAKELAAKVPFKGDQNALNDSIAKYEGATDYVEALNILNAAMTEANNSIAKYLDYVPEDGTIDGKTLPTVQNTLKKYGGDGYGAAEDIMQFAYDYVMNWMKNDTASYTMFDETVNLLKNYLNIYTPAYNQAADVAASATTSAQESLNTLMASQKEALVSEMKDLATVNAYVEELSLLVAAVEKQNIYDDPNATDYTAYILNPMLASETGWTFNKGNGNNNTGGGQWLNGDSNIRYIDSYNSAGLEGYIATQLITGLPNGTYTVGAYTRTPAEGAYIFHAVGNDTTFVEIPLDYYQTYTETGEDTTVVASDKWGPIWEAAKAAFEAGTYNDEQYNTYNANGSEGRGWKYQEMTGIVVTDHQLLIGTMAGTAASKTEKVFAGAWYSVGGWTLTLTAKGDNTGWEGPIASGIKTLKGDAKNADAIYTLTGAKIGKLQRGLNIVISNGKTRKIMVK